MESIRHITWLVTWIGFLPYLSAAVVKTNPPSVYPHIISVWLNSSKLLRSHTRSHCKYGNRINVNPACECWLNNCRYNINCLRCQSTICRYMNLCHLRSPDKVTVVRANMTHHTPLIIVAITLFICIKTTLAIGKHSNDHSGWNGQSQLLNVRALVMPFPS